MKRLGTLVMMLSTLSGSVAFAAVDANSSGYESVSGGAEYVASGGYVDPMVSVQPRAETVTEVAAREAAAAEGTDVAKNEANVKACREALEKADKSGASADKDEAAKTCEAVDYSTVAPAGGPDAAVAETPAKTIGSDANDRANYYPPQNPSLNGKQVSWAKLESFKQMMKAEGFDDNAIGAVAGNLQHESGMFYLNQWKYDTATGKHVLVGKPYGALSRGDYQNGQYTSFGIAQYHKERATDMLQQVGGKSLSPNGLQGTHNAQVAYMIKDLKKELNGTNYAALTNPNVSTYTKTGIIVQKYERPKEVATEVFGRMGGRDRLNSAMTLQAAMNMDVMPDVNSQNSTGKGGRPVTNAGTSGYVVTGNGNGNVIGGNGYALATGNGGLGVSFSQALGLGGAGNSGLLNYLMVSSLLGKIGSSDKDDSDAVASTTTGSTTTTTVTVSPSTPVSTTLEPHGFDAIAELKKTCGSDLPATNEAIMLMIQDCRKALESQS